MASPLFTFSSFTAIMASCILASEGTTVPAIYAFGDSTADVGNNNYLPTAAKANFPPYGIDFPGGIPTGRFTNGYNGIDFLAKMFGFKQSPPAFLSITNEREMLQGVNFASGSSGIFDSTGTAIPFTTQVTNFKNVTDLLKKRMGKIVAINFLSKSLCVISTGSNDMFGYYSEFGSQNTTMNEQFITSLVNKFEDQLKVLYMLGARKFGIVGIGHIGCIPYILARNPLGRCIEELNGLARLFNTVAKARMHNLLSILKGMKYSYWNTYDLVTLVFSKPHIYGYTEVKVACCGSGKFNGETSCTANTSFCSNRDDYYVWDWIHPTEATYKLIAMKSYSGSLKFATPINMKQLAAY